VSSNPSTYKNEKSKGALLERPTFLLPPGRHVTHTHIEHLLFASVLSHNEVNKAGLYLHQRNLIVIAVLRKMEITNPPFCPLHILRG
jgi:hypothetical protein